MRALVFRVDSGLGLEDLPVPEPGPNEVLFRPQYAQVCLTDVLNVERFPPMWPEHPGRQRQLGGRWPYQMTDGMVPGHEGGGEVVAVGAQVEGIIAGDRIVAEVVFHCGACPECVRLAWRDCRTFQQGGQQGDAPVPTFLGVNSPDPVRFGRGLMAEYCVLPANMCTVVPSSVSAQGMVAYEIGGATLTSVRSSGMQIGDNIVQIGGQLFGSYRMQLCRIAGANRIIYVEENKTRREWARRNSLADLIINPATTDVVAAVRQAMPAGADVVHVSNCHPQSWALASKVVRPRGTIVPFDADPRLDDSYLDGFDAAALTAQDVHWVGSWPPIGVADAVKGGWAREDQQIFLDLMSQGRIDGALPITRVISLGEDIDQLTQAFRDQWVNEVRVVVQISGDVR